MGLIYFKLYKDFFIGKRVKKEKKPKVKLSESNPDKQDNDYKPEVGIGYVTHPEKTEMEVKE
jgi:hypothetical protein